MKSCRVSNDSFLRGKGGLRLTEVIGISNGGGGGRLKAALVERFCETKIDIHVNRQFCLPSKRGVKY